MLHLLKVCALWRLGPVSLLRVGVYRALLRMGIYRRMLPIAKPVTGPFFDWSAAQTTLRLPESIDVTVWGELADRIIRGEMRVFSNRWIESGFPPRWQRSVISQIDTERSGLHWTLIPDFGLPGGDVKGYWEVSRFDGLIILVLGWLCTHRVDIAAAIEHWMSSWCADNPANSGLQWKCGQETAIRLMQGLLAMALMQRWGDVLPTAAFREWVEQHCKRIAPTMIYAVGQDNNHGTSEAAALFVGGNWLITLGVAEGVRWARKGRHWLENRVVHLIGPQGSFSQYSLNYHRLMLDTLCMVEVWRRRLDMPAFSSCWYQRTLAATQWLRHMVNPINGDGPNVGANDGARLLQLTDAPYRDYRPSIQLAMALFAGQRAYIQDGAYNEPLKWLDLSLPAAISPAASHYFADDGGFTVLRRGAAMAMIRYPRFKFRPSHADALHLDLWVNENNLLRDDGTYGYNTDQTWLNYFGGTAAHNTVQFDSRDQMPRVNRFLFGDWLTTNWLQPISDENQSTHFAVGYLDAGGACQRRSVTLSDSQLKVEDRVTGFKDTAILRWRLCPGNWQMETRPTSTELVNLDEPNQVLSVSASIPISRCELVEGWESRNYLEKSPVPVLEIEVHNPGILTTVVHWSS